MKNTAQQPVPSRLLTIATFSGLTVANDLNRLLSGARGQLLLRDVRLIGKLQHANRARRPKRVVHAKGTGVRSAFTVAHNAARQTNARLLTVPGKKTGTVLQNSAEPGKTYGDGMRRALFQQEAV